MLNNIKEKITCVRGNCDSEVDQMVLEFPMMADYALMTVNGKTLFLTHGHRYNVKETYEEIRRKIAKLILFS